MNVIHAPEQRALAVTTYRRWGSFATTIRVLGCPSGASFTAGSEGIFQARNPSPSPGLPSFIRGSLKPSP